MHIYIIYLLRYGDRLRAGVLAGSAPHHRPPARSAQTLLDAILKQYRRRGLAAAAAAAAAAPPPPPLPPPPPTTPTPNFDHAWPGTEPREQHSGRRSDWAPLPPPPWPSLHYVHLPPICGVRSWESKLGHPELEDVACLSFGVGEQKEANKRQRQAVLPCLCLAF